MEIVQLPSNDVLLANIVNFLLESDEKEAAFLLLGCEVEAALVPNVSFDVSVALDFFGSRSLGEVMRDPQNELIASISHVSNQVVAGYDVAFMGMDFKYKVGKFDYGPNWRDEMVDFVKNIGVSNQCLPFYDENGEPVPVRQWKYLRFRSASEIKIAEELDNRGVLFFPNCARRVTTNARRAKKEPDFLIFYKGQWGILEVDGGNVHTSATKDHARDLAFKHHGIKVIHRFDANDCFNNTRKVISDFLSILEA